MRGLSRGSRLAFFAMQVESIGLCTTMHSYKENRSTQSFRAEKSECIKTLKVAPAIVTVPANIEPKHRRTFYVDAIFKDSANPAARRYTQHCRDIKRKRHLLRPQELHSPYTQRPTKQEIAESSRMTWLPHSGKAMLSGTYSNSATYPRIHLHFPAILIALAHVSAHLRRTHAFPPPLILFHHRPSSLAPHFPQHHICTFPQNTS
jgi:hypothetical protein